MLHKVLIDAVSNQATRLLMSEKGLPAPEVEKQNQKKIKD